MKSHAVATAMLAYRINYLKAQHYMDYLQVTKAEIKVRVLECSVQKCSIE